jgi:hypothetical protein
MMSGDSELHGSWRLTRIGRKPVLQAAPITADFSPDGRLTG